MGHDDCICVLLDEGFIMTSLADFRQQVADYAARVRRAGKHEDCPLCDQGTLIKASVVATTELVTFCEECDSIWPDGVLRNADRAETFEAFLRASGKRGIVWSELKIS